MQRLRVMIASVTLWIVFTTPAPVSADMNLFSPEVDYSGETFVLHGQGTLKYKRIISVYDAALYLPPDLAPNQALDDIPRRLEVVYRVAAKADRFAEAGNDVLQRLIPSEQLDAMRGRVDRIHAWFPDHKKGDRCAITYIPGRGTELTYNGESLGVIEGPDFAYAYFSIWLADDPACPRLRDALLSNNLGTPPP